MTSPYERCKNKTEKHTISTGTDNIYKRKDLQQKKEIVYGNVYDTRRKYLRTGFFLNTMFSLCYRFSVYILSIICIKM